VRVMCVTLGCQLVLDVGNKAPVSSHSLHYRVLHLQHRLAITPDDPSGTGRPGRTRRSGDRPRARYVVFHIASINPAEARGTVHYSG
jgi:hypothetical protein